MSLLPGASFQPVFLPSLGGGQLALPRGPALLFFFEADSEACAHAARAVARTARALAHRGLAVVAISRSEPGATRAFVAAHDLGEVDVALDLTSLPASSEFELDRVPAAYVVEDAVVRAVVEGWSRHDYNALAAAAAEVVNAAPPTASDPGDGLPDYL